jgi:hypothetical protein
MNARTTLKNLVCVIGTGGMPLSSLSVYVYYILRKNEPTTYRQIRKDLLLSMASINRHNKVLAVLGALEIDSHPGRATVYKPKDFSDLQLKQVLRGNAQKKGGLLRSSSLDIYNKDLDIRRDIYNRMFKYRRQEERAGSVPARDLADSTPTLKTIIDALPSNQRSFKVNPKSMKRLQDLESKVDVASYIKWFVRVKLERLIPRFNMGIFLYSGMIDEFKAIAKKSEKVDKYKTVAKRLKGHFEDRAKKFKEEVEDG